MASYARARTVSHIGVLRCFFYYFEEEQNKLLVKLEVEKLL